MNAKKLVLTTIATLTLGFIGTTCAVAKDVVTIKIGHVSQEGVPIDRWAKKFGEVVAHKSNGELVVEVYPSSALGGNRELLEQLQLGSLEGVISSVAFLGGFTNTTKALDLPYLFANNAAAETVLDGDVGQEIFKNLEPSGFIGLGWLATGWRHVTANKEIHAPTDMKGLKIRVMDNPLHIAHFNAIGASAIPMAFSEVFTALQQKTIDCQENPLANIQGNRLNEVQKYIVKTGHVYDTAPFLYSQVLWDKLSPEHQALIRESVKETLGWEREISAKDELEIENKFKSNGKNVVIDLTPEERQKFREAAQPVYDQFKDEIGADLIQRIADAQKSL